MTQTMVRVTLLTVCVKGPARLARVLMSTPQAGCWLPQLHRRWRQRLRVLPLPLWRPCVPQKPLF